MHSTAYTTDRLPAFSLDHYRELLRALTNAGYKFAPVTDMPQYQSGYVAYIRHDIDIHLDRIDEMARIEAESGVVATYYILLTQQYNPLEPHNRRILQQIRTLGHTIGLHYDLETYPGDQTDAQAHLEAEVHLLATLVGSPVQTIVMHQPHQGQPDFFKSSNEYVHPHDPRWQNGLLYVSDSCRAWRDESLLQCFGSDPPARLLLTIHPELWLDGTVLNRMEYLDQVLLHNSVRRYHAFVNGEVRRIWQSHPAPALHDKREAQR